MTARGLVALLALLVASVGVLGPQAVGASEHKTFTADLQPPSVPAGSSVTFTATLVNTSTQHQLGSANITAPAVLTLTRVEQPMPQGTATLNGDTVELRNLSAPAGATIQVRITGQAPCAAGSGNWTVRAKQANNFQGPPGNDLVLNNDDPELNLSLAVTGTCRLVFVDHPNHAEPHPTVISSAVGDPAGPPITVAAVDGDDQPITSFTGDVTVAIGDDPSEGAATLGGTTTQAADAGVASFDDLTIDQLGVGFTLVSSSPGYGSATSKTFGIWQDIGVCTAGGTCTASADDPKKMSASVTAKSSTAGAILLSFGVDTVDCGDSANHAPTTTTVDSVGVDGVKTATITVAKAVDQEQPNNGVSFYEVCYKSPEQFTDQDGNVTNEGLLPDCGTPVIPPCVASRTKTKAGDVQIVISLPAGDPSWR